MNYLLACKTCGNQIPVSTGQAGQTVRCECGEPVDVPSIRELRNLPLSENEAASGPAWGRRQGMFFVGGTIAVAALAGIGILWLIQPTLVDVRKDVGEADAATLQAEIKAVAPDENYMRWESIRPWPPKLFAEKKDEEVPPYLIASQELIKAFEAGGAQFLTPKTAKPILEKIQLRSNQNVEALIKRKQFKEWIVILATASGIGLVIGAAGFLVPAETAGGRVGGQRRVPQSMR